MPKSDGYKNLIPTNKRSKDEARMLGQKGGGGVNSINCLL